MRISMVGILGGCLVAKLKLSFDLLGSLAGADFDDRCNKHHELALFARELLGSI